MDLNDMEGAKILLLVILVVVVGWFLLDFLWNWYYVKRAGYGSLLPPGDMGLPLFGNNISLLKSLIFTSTDSFVDCLVSRYGETGIYKLHMLGRPSIMVTKAEICKEVLCNDEDFKLDYPVDKTEKSNSSAEGAAHRRIRKHLLAPVSGQRALGLYTKLIEANALACLDELASMNKAIEFLCELKHIIFKTLFNVLVGLNHDSLVVDQMEKLVDEMWKALHMIPIDFPGFAFRKAKKSRLELGRIIGGLIEERKMDLKRNGGTPMLKKCTLDDLLLNRGDGNNEQLDDEEIKELLIALLFAGGDTAAHSIMWAIIYLDDHPKMMQNAKDEQEKIIRNRPSTQQGLSLEEVKDMDFLSKIIEETLRKSNIASLIVREAKRDVKLNGYLIPKGWKVLVVPRAVHMDAKFYPNPTQFDPSRWDDDNGKLKRTGAFIPFGGGSRRCPASELAKLQASIVLHYFLLGYRLERVNPNCSVVYLPIPKPRDNCLGKIVKL